MTSPSKFGLPLPSVFTPFFRRFTDEKALDIKETRTLFAAVTARHRETRWSKAEVDADFAEVLFELIGTEVPRDLQLPIFTFLVEMLKLEKPIFESPPEDTDVATLSLKELVDLRRFLRSQEHFLDHEDKVITTLGNTILGMLDGLLAEVPKLDAPSPFTIPLIHLLPNPPLIVDKVHGTFIKNEALDLGLFTEVNEQRELNLCAVYGVAPNQEIKKPLKPIAEQDWTPREAVDNVLKRTPFHDFLLSPVPLKFDHETRYNHVHVIGGSGAGKTQLLQNLILHDLQSEEPPALVIVDSQSDLIGKISRMELFNPDGGKLAGKLTLITPREINDPPAINIFDVNTNRHGQYSAAMREQVVAGVIETFDYLFAGLLGADLTAKQSVFFRFVARLMLSLPETLGRNATILDMMNLMDDTSPYREAIASLPPIQRNFFERDFQSTSFRQTKEQIRYRLQAILENPTLARLFTSSKTKVDLFSEINGGGIILIDTAKDFLKGSSAHFGRIFISLVLQAALERAAIPERQRRPAFLVVDEAADYFDDNIDDLLTQVRKYKVGCLFAHQFLDQCTSSLRASLAANTGTKLCAALSMSDARSLAADMRTTPDFVLAQKKLSFAGFVRNVTPEAVSIPVEAGLLERQEQMPRHAYDRLRDLNSRKVSTTRDPVEVEDDNQGEGADGANEDAEVAAHETPRPPNGAPVDKSSRRPAARSPWTQGTKAQPNPHQPAPKAPRPAKPQPKDDDPVTDW